MILKTISSVYVLTLSILFFFFFSYLGGGGHKTTFWDRWFTDNLLMMVFSSIIIFLIQCVYILILYLVFIPICDWRQRRLLTLYHSAYPPANPSNIKAQVAQNRAIGYLWFSINQNIVGLFAVGIKYPVTISRHLIRLIGVILKAASIGTVCL